MSDQWEQSRWGEKRKLPVRYLPSLFSKEDVEAAIKYVEKAYPDAVDRLPTGTYIELATKDHFAQYAKDGKGGKEKAGLVRLPGENSGPESGILMYNRREKGTLTDLLEKFSRQFMDLLPPG